MCFIRFIIIERLDRRLHPRRGGAEPPGEFGFRRDGNDGNDDDGDDDDDDIDDGISFIPYSTKNNWLNRYPHAAPAIECDDDGKVLVYLNWRPYPNGLAELGQDMGIDAAAVAAVAGCQG